MRLEAPGQPHLTYCTNIHPGETWPEVRENLERYLVPIRRRVAAGRPFGLGLRLSAVAAEELGREGALARFREFLEEHDLYVFTINGFPYGPFHGRPVKERVYLPDWLDPARLEYTNRLAELLALLLPNEARGTISTVPGAFAPRVGGDDGAARMAELIARHAAHLRRLHEATGRRIALAIEPEPCCYLETVGQTVDFFERHLFGAAGVAVLARLTGLSRPRAEEVLREHVGVCLDTCHMAVEFEDPVAALRALERAGIRVAKVQVSAGLRLVVGGEDPSAQDGLRAFADDIYLHQVVERRSDGRLMRYVDLPQALEAAGAAPAAAREWRVHFHVPLFHERLGVFESTQDYVREVLALLRDSPRCNHFEVETYTWDVLPPEFRRDDVVTAVARELEWTADQLSGAPTAAGRDA